MDLNRELRILRWVGIALACLSTLFTLAIVGSHLTGRLQGLGRIGILGTVGAELMAITTAWMVASECRRVAIVAMVSQLILTGVLLVNASIALDLDWQEKLADKAAERHFAAEMQAEQERRKTLEKQAELAWQLSDKDKLLARAFVSTAARPQMTEIDIAPAAVEAPRKIGFYERYGLTVMPLFLALVALIALALAAQSDNRPRPGRGDERRKPKRKPETMNRLGRRSAQATADLQDQGASFPPAQLLQ